MQEKERWNSQFGFVISGVGAAIGLGSLWLFPWRLNDCGGGSFLILFFFFLFVFVRLGLTAEIAFGRFKNMGPLGSFRAVFPKKLKPLATCMGVLPGLALLAILCFYLIVTGWITSYTFKYLFQAKSMAAIDSVAYFKHFSETWHTIPGFLVAVFTTMIIVIFGVKKGIETTNKIAMPIFFALILILLVRSVTLPGASGAFRFIFSFSYEAFLKPYTWIMALDQAFFTVSLGGMLTYGSYLTKKSDVVQASFWTIFFGAMASILVALVIIPALFAFKIDLNSGPSLFFVTIPKLCSNMPGGNWFGPAFFVCAFLAAISSSANLMETSVATLSPLLKIGRKLTSVIIAIITLIIGFFLSYDINIFTKWTNVVTVYVYPFVPLFIQIAFIWVFGPNNAIKEIKIGSNFYFPVFDQFILKYIFPLICLIMIVLSIVSNC